MMTASGGSREADNMRTTLLLSGAALLAGAMCLADDNKANHKRAEKGTAQSATKLGENANERPVDKLTPKSEVKTSTVPSEKKPLSQPVAAKPSADEEAIRQTDESFVKAYTQGDVKAIAVHFTTNAEYVDELGNVFQGRDAIEESLTAFFLENPKCSLAMNIDTIRFLSPEVAVQDGSTNITLSETKDSIDSRYTTVHVKTDGKWLAASVREHAPKDRNQHHAQLEHLGWLLGDWVDEGDESIVNFSCESVDNGNFLRRKFTILVAGQEAMSGTQQIGWDSQTIKLRTWIFDSEGAYGEGLWNRDGKNWVIKTIGVTADGQTASRMKIYSFVNDHTMTWKSVDHEISGVQQPDSELFRIVNQSPTPSPDVAGDLKQCI
jgi:uncharacterized protein (TIGR02246 family)